MTDATTSPHDLADTMIGILMDRDPSEAHAQARALLAAATTVLQDRFGTVTALDALSNFTQAVQVRGAPSEPVLVPPPAPASATPAPAPSLPPESLAGAVLDHLCTLPRGEAHERAQAVIAGAAAYLHTIFGDHYAAAAISGTLQAAENHAFTLRGGQADGATLH